MANLGPLTTTFTPTGADCTSTFLAIVGQRTALQYGMGNAASVSCEPYNFSPYWSEYYSPGVCPSGYTIDWSSSNSPLSGYTEKTTTTAAYCPSSYSYVTARANDDPYGCLSCFVEPIVFSTIETWSSGCIGAHAPRLHFASGDILIASPTDSSTSTGDQEGSGPAETGTSSSNSDSNSSGLSMGAAIGIAIGVGLGGVLFTGAVIMLFIRRRRQKRNPPTTLATNYDVAKYNQSPLQSPPPQELFAQRSPQELSSQDPMIRQDHAYELYNGRD
ncbi:hypothetical protein F5Y15DRAFT_425403 [Xylariaceae sp. FL0016]|nr:hypothetical protein F5Y15DRAFT_425403 [Xylariaceae sp. FL0016]